MSDYKQAENSANLFYNDVGDNPKRPNWKTISTVTFNGVEGRISGWTKTAKNGNEYISIKFETTTLDVVPCTLSLMCDAKLPPSTVNAVVKPELLTLLTVPTNFLRASVIP